MLDAVLPVLFTVGIMVMFGFVVLQFFWNDVVGSAVSQAAAARQCIDSTPPSSCSSANPGKRCLYLPAAEECMITRGKVKCSMTEPAYELVRDSSCGVENA